MSSELAIRVSGLTKQYDIFSSPWARLLHLFTGQDLNKRRVFTALQDVNFELPRGHALGVIGRNGAGKSTLLQLICNTLEPSQGKVEVNGRLVALLELGAGFNPEFTGRENVYTNGAIYGLSRSQVDKLMPAIIDFAEIGDFLDQPVKTYSSGMFMRLAFSVIAHLEPDIMVIDEALAVGDVYFTQKCMRFLREFAKHGTLLFVSHDTHSVINLCQQAIWLDKGKVAAYGLAKPVCDAYLGSFYENNLGKDESRSERGESAHEFGLGGAKITEVRLLNEKREPLYLVECTQPACLEIDIHALQDITAPITGFFIKDRTGQMILGENTLKRSEAWEQLEQGRRYRVRFEFLMPHFGTGTYTIGVAVAAGTQQQHVQHHWIHDAIAFKSQADPALTGIQTVQQFACEIEDLA